jgi:RNA polymerase sigma-70 factor (ECF subfamily)
MEPVNMSQASAQPAFTDESDLIARSRQGDGQAFTLLVNRYERKIFRLDGFQEQSKLYTWLVRIAVNESLMKLRKRRTGKLLSLDENIDTGEETVAREIAVWDDNPEQRYSREEMQSILRQAIDSLPPIFRTVFVLRDVDELSTEEAAEALGISVPAVKSRLLRARLQLRDRLTKFFKRKVENAYSYL